MIRWDRSIAIALVFATRTVAAQTSDSSTQKTFFTGRDALIGLGILGASAGLSAFDARIARNFQDTNHLHVRAGKRVDDVFTRINESTLTVGGLALYAIARAFHAHTVATVSFHVSEAVAAASISNQLIRGPLGRTRPRDANPPFENQYDFEFMKGFTSFQHRAFPSIHSSSGFAAASVLVAEVQHRAPGATTASRQRGRPRSAPGCEYRDALQPGWAPSSWAAPRTEDPGQPSAEGPATSRSGRKR